MVFRFYWNDGPRKRAKADYAEHQPARRNDGRVLKKGKMEIDLLRLSPGTIFKHKGITYRSTTLYWTAGAAKGAGKYKYTGIDSTDQAQVVSVVPKYGGRFQPELSVYIDAKTVVEVEP